MIRDLLEFVGILPDWKERKKREELASWGKPTTPDGKAPHKPQTSKPRSSLKKEDINKLHLLYAPHLPKMDPRDNPTLPWCRRGYHKETLTKQSSYERNRAVEENLKILRNSLGDKFTLIRVENLPASNKGFTAVLEYEVAYD